ncbi:hypothetical protein DUGA2_60680 [Duganella sp. HH101]|nr:hypothetical protein DUGA2_60680 [Duganella sp. HH101]
MALLAAVLAPPASAADPLAACRLPEMQLRTDVGLGFPRKPDRLQTTGQLRFRVLFVDFSDAPATVAPRDVLSIISPRAERHLQALLASDAHGDTFRIARAATHRD